MKKIQPTITTNRYNSHDTWELINPVLAAGEIGIESDTKQFKFGDGITQWNSLPYTSGEGGGGSSTIFEITYGETDATKIPTYSVAANPTTVIKANIVDGEYSYSYSYGTEVYDNGYSIISYFSFLGLEDLIQPLYLTLVYDTNHNFLIIDWSNVDDPLFIQKTNTTLSETSDAPIANSTVTKALAAKQDQLNETQLSVINDTDLASGNFVSGSGADTTNFWLQAKSGEKLYVRPGTDITFTKNGDNDISINCDSDAIAAKVLASLPEYRGEVEYDGTITVEDIG